MTPEEHAKGIPARFHAQGTPFDIVFAIPEGNGTRVKYREHNGDRTAEIVVAHSVDPVQGVKALAKQIAAEMHADAHSDRVPDCRP
jgi:hypothetical protein